MAIFDYNPSAITPFPYWRWNKVLPAVYDDSVSQYEMLCRLLHVVNNIIESTNSTGEQVEALTQLVQQLIDGGFPDGLVEYVNQMVNAAMADDIEAINAAIQDINDAIDSEKVISNLVTPSSNLAPWKLVEIFRSYLPYNNRFKYGAGSFLGMTYNENTNTYSPTTINGVREGNVNKFYASCATAVEACLCGYSYEFSRMATGNVVGTNPPQLIGGSNTPISGMYSLDMYNQTVRAKYAQNTTTGYIYSSGLAHWLYDIGLLREIKSTGNYSELAAGDIVFFTTEEDYDTYWHGIGHVAIYLGPWFTGAMFAEVNTVEPIWKYVTRSINTMQSIKYYARIPIQANDAPINLVAERYPYPEYPNGYSYNGASSPGVPHMLQFDADKKFVMQPNSIYTCVMHITDISGDNVRISVNGGKYITGGTTYDTKVVGSLQPANPQCCLGNDTYWCVVKTPSTDEADFTEQPFNGIYFRPYADSAFNMVIDNVQFYDRLIQPSQINSIIG